MRENIGDIINNQNGINSWNPVELIVNNIQNETKIEGNSEEKMDMEMSVKFMRIKERKERKRINKYIFLGILIVLILIIIILFI